MAISLFRQPCLAQSGGKVVDIRLVLVWLYSQVLCDREARCRQQDFGRDFPRTGDSVRVSVACRNIGERPLWNDWSMRKVCDGLVVLASNEVGDTRVRANTTPDRRSDPAVSPRRDRQSPRPGDRDSCTGSPCRPRRSGCSDSSRAPCDSVAQQDRRPMRSAAALSVLSSLESAAPSSALASTHAAPETQVIASLVAMIEC
jgi:hypothetical protein